jgi:TonB family protein
LALLAVRAPEVARAAGPPPERRTLVVLPTFRFQPPADVPEVVRQPLRRRVPVPDATPADPEPIRAEIYEPVPTDLAIDDGVLGIPEAPPEPEPEVEPRIIGGEVLAPRKLHAPAPAYTEIARRARLEGIVVLRATIDAAGNVVDVRVERSLGLGLDESAVEAVRRWTFAPGTLHGRPVPVFYHLTVRFELR